MLVDDVFRRRRSIRRFKATPVNDEALSKLIWAASLAPTARNIQPWEFVVIRSPKVKREIARHAPNAAFINDAPACIALFCKETKYYLEDGSAATTQALLCAAAMGLGACWVAGDKKDYAPFVSRLLKCPPGLKLVSLIAVGEPDEEPIVKKRDVSAMLHREEFER